VEGGQLVARGEQPARQGPAENRVPLAPGLLHQCYLNEGAQAARGGCQPAVRVE